MNPGTVDGVPAGGVEYLSTKLNELRKGQKDSLTVAAGDLTGGSPFFSGLFHDEPSMESMNAVDLDVSGAGNHEFDEGVTGAQIQSVLEDQCQPAGSSRPFLHLDVSEGFTYDLAFTIDSTGPAGTCSSVSITSMRLNGVPIDRTTTYQVTANNFTGIVFPRPRFPDRAGGHPVLAAGRLGLIGRPPVVFSQQV